jgi:hypothetical protein
VAKYFILFYFNLCLCFGLNLGFGVVVKFMCMCQCVVPPIQQVFNRCLLSSIKRGRNLVRNLVFPVIHGLPRIYHSSMHTLHFHRLFVTLLNTGF